MLKILIVSLFYVLIMGCASAEAQVSRTDKLKALATKVAKQHNLDPKLFKAIIKQESNWRVNAINKQTRDLGLGQISPYNVKAYKLDSKRLLKDAEYNLNASATILAWFKRTYAHKDPLWYARYNCGSGPMNERKLPICLKYAGLIQKHLDNRTIAKEF